MATLIQQYNALATELNNQNIYFDYLIFSNNRLIEQSEGYRSNLYNIASATKIYTATICLILFEQKIIDIYKDITYYMPELKDVFYKDVNLHSLLNHTAGLEEYVTEEDCLKILADTEEYKTVKAIANLKQTETKIGKFYYSNTHYILLALIIEKVCNLKYVEIFKNTVKEKYGLQNTTHNIEINTNDLIPPKIDENLNCNHIINYSYYNDYCFSSGGIATTCYELYKFLYLLFIKKTVLSIDTLNLMLQFNSGGYGLGIFNIENGNIIGHPGDNFGYFCRNYINIKEKNIIILCANIRRNNSISDFLKTLKSYL